MDDDLAREAVDALRAMTESYRDALNEAQLWSLPRADILRNARAVLARIAANSEEEN